VATAAERTIDTALAAGLELCLANPGTTEIPLVQALETRPGRRAVLALHENGCTGAADGYARIAGKPALTLLHLGPGLANGTSNLHNARRANSPVVNLIGEHATWHISADAPLAMDIDRLAGTFSRWVGRIIDPDEVGALAAQAIAGAMSGGGGVATLIFPHDLQMATSAAAIAAPQPAPLSPIGPASVERAAILLGERRPAAIFLGGRALFGQGLRIAGRIAQRTGCTLLAEVGFARLEAGAGLPPLQRLPYLPEAAKAALDRHRAVVGIGAKPPVSFFGWPGHAGRYLEGRDDVVWLADRSGDAVAALGLLADALDAGEPYRATAADPLDLPTGPLDAVKTGAVLAALQPEGAIIVPTAVTSSFPYGLVSARARPHTQIALTGGAIGEGPALAVGAALAAPDRRIINLEADGSGAYAVQALWTQAREGLDVTTIICSNRAYKILRVELERAGVASPGPVASSLTDLGRPPIDWPSVARVFGVPGERVETAEALATALRRSLEERGPRLIEALFADG
jgi:acetolactate synthase-1/2/3 large subunit